MIPRSRGWRLFLAGACALAACAYRSPQEPLTRVVDVERLPPDEAARGRPVHLEGTIGFAHDAVAYLCDPTGCIAIHTALRALEMYPHRSTVVRIRGRTVRPGQERRIEADRIRVLGQVNLADETAPVGLVADVAQGRVGPRFVVVAGRVLAVTDEGPDQRLELLAEDRHFDVHLGDFSGCGYPPLLGAEVQVRGVATLVAAGGGRVAHMQLLVPQCSTLRVVQDGPGALAKETAPPSLTRVVDVRALTPERAAQALPVKVRGVVTFCDSRGRLLFVQDETAGIYVSAWRHVYDFEPGQEVEVRGESEPGLYAPTIDHPRIRVLGRRALPAPRRVLSPEAISGALDSQWVEVEGVIREITDERSGLALSMTSALGPFMAYVAEFHGLLPPKLIDARVRVRGVWAVLFNDRRQRSGFKIWVSSLSDVTVVEPGPSDASAPAITHIEDLTRFSDREQGGERVKVRGVFTLREGDEAIDVQEGGVGVRVETHTKAPLRLGDVVEASGLPAPGAFSPKLTNAVVRVIQPGPDVAPVSIDPEQALRGNFDRVLVRIQGRVVGRVDDDREPVLNLEDGSYTFRAHLMDGGDGFDSIPLESTVQVTGVGFVRWAEGGPSLAQAFGVLLRSGADIRVLRAPPFWTRARVVSLLVAMGLLLLIGVAWVHSLRQTVVRQTAVIREKVEQKAMLEERNRIAGEVHDGLAQAIAAILFRLETIRMAVPSTAHAAIEGLAATRSVVLEALADASRSIREVSVPTAPLGLERALRQMLGRFGAGAPIDLSVEVDGPSLDADTEYEIVRVAQEAVANAVRHAEGSRVRVEVTFPNEKILLRVVDDGPGFDAAHLEEKMESSPGLSGMRRRASNLKGQLVVRSAPGRGTEVSLQVPADLR